MLCLENVVSAECAAETPRQAATTAATAQHFDKSVNLHILFSLRKIFLSIDIRPSDHKDPIR
jgi:hypothetical protein